MVENESTAEQQVGAQEQDDEQQGEDAQRVLAQLRAIHELRGRLLSDMCFVEEALDFAITVYFFPAKSPHTYPFKVWILSTLTLDAKIAIVRNIMDGLGLTDTMPTLLGELLATKDARNRQAHASLVPNIDDSPIADDPANMLKWKLQRTSRKGIQDIDPRELTREIDLVHNVYLGVARLGRALLANRSGKDIEQSLASFDAANSKEAMWSTIFPIINDPDGMLLDYYTIRELDSAVAAIGCPHCIASW